MGITKIYFFGQTPIKGVDHIPLQTTLYIDPQCDFSNYDFFIITSKRAIKAMQSFSYDFKEISLYCVGKKTAEYALSQGLNVVHTAQGYAKDLIAEIKPMIQGKRGLYLRPKSVANRYITDEVKAGKIDEAICYETLCVKPVHSVIDHPAIFLFSAPSQVACFLQHFGFESDDIAVVIGTTTRKSLPETIKVYQSDEQRLQSLYEKAKSLSLTIS